MPLKEFKQDESSEAAQRPTPKRPKLELLYVEDEDLNWEVTEMHLKTSYSLDRARNAEEALRFLGRKTYHAILMDIQLARSDLDGIGITKVLRGTYTGHLPDYAKQFPTTEVPIIFMSAYSARYTKNDLKAVGGDDLIVKPIDFTQLSFSISRCLMKSINKKP